MDIIYCPNLDCDCTKVTFNIRELLDDGESVAEGLIFRVQMDGRTWEEIDPPPRSPEVARLVQETITLRWR